MSTISLKKKREKAKFDYLNGMPLKKIAKKYDVALNTVKTWRSRYNWVREKSPFHGNQYAVRNKGGAPKGNKNSAKHGMFSKFIPPETLEAMSFLDEKDPLDILWDQIKIQYAAILRAQEIMFVANKDELIKVESKLRESPQSLETTYEIQFAWDRQATFMNAQSRAMAELRALIRQYVDMTYEDDERKLKLRQMQINLRKIKAEIKRIQKEIEEGLSNGNETTIIISNEDEMRKALADKVDNNNKEETDE